MMWVTHKSLSEPRPRSGEELEKMNSDVENCSLPLSQSSHSSHVKGPESDGKQPSLGIHALWGIWWLHQSAVGCKRALIHLQGLTLQKFKTLNYSQGVYRNGGKQRNYPFFRTQLIQTQGSLKSRLVCHWTTGLLSACSLVTETRFSVRSSDIPQPISEKEQHILQKEACGAWSPFPRIDSHWDAETSKGQGKNRHTLTGP